MKKLLITCYKCNQEIDLIQLGTRDSESINQFKKHLEEELTKTIESQITTRLHQTYSLEFESQKKDLELEKEKVVSSLKNNIDILNTSIEAIKLNNQRDLKELEANLKAKFLEEKQVEVTTLMNKIQKLEAEASSLDQLNEQKLQKQKLELESNFNLQKAQWEAKTTQALLEVQKIESENKLLLNQKELELKTKYEEVISSKEKEITDLKVANATNRILNNKTKGENWENEVELELRKLASLTGDEINKITRTGTKADFLQVVREKELDLGKIVFECKNGEWKDSWEPKLTEDMAKEGANYAVLVATSTGEKFKVPFLVSQKNKNILIADPDSFVFVSSMVRKLILIESNLRDKSDNNEAFEKFNSWKLKSFETFKGIIQKSIEAIEGNERTIINKVEDIKKNREKLWRNWQTLMLDFLEGFNI
ncbi:DUF2130 domain-containing protein [Spiroplasma cantharicola]|uniref:DUF2130 domain-containing protein n=1 Tax=Spiroplasma cantharicola TaxID=362837 RepID=A0A0M4JSM4_9MOLU|nr:DUF2130 domain-containing protein [Spiroplasma cantharicola]ALD66585.1 hypothetical protein SCANT_v1c06790 [Spiroplasma cantharicola]